MRKKSRLLNTSSVDALVDSFKKKNTDYVSQVKPEFQEQQTSCLTANTIMRFAAFRKLDVRELISPLVKPKGPYNVAYLADTNNWILHTYTKQLYQQLINLLDDEGATYDAARHTYQLNSLTFLEAAVRVSARLFTGPDTAYRNARRLSWKFNRIYQMEPHTVTKTHAVIEVTYFPEFEPTQAGCRYTEGILAVAPQVWNMPNAHIEHEQCVLDGNPSCIYQIDYSKKRFFQSLIPRSSLETIENLLEENYQALQDKVDALRTTNAQLHEQLEINAKQHEELLRTQRIFFGALAHEVGNATSATSKNLDELVDLVDEESSFDLGQDLDTLACACQSYAEQAGVPKEQFADELLGPLKRLKRLRDVLAVIAPNAKLSYNRVEGIVQEMRQIAQMDKQKRGDDLVALDPIVDDIYHHHFESSDIIFTYTGKGKHVLGSTHQIYSILDILLHNAKEAVTEHKRTKTMVCLDITEEVFKDKLYKRFIITDTGRGLMSEQTRDVFRPFYSTKEGNMRGLGLTYAQYLVQLYEGSISLRSEPGSGTSFFVYLRDYDGTG
ncbi:MAG: ATP-binding protein [Nanobdellota archaeon]